MIAIDVTPLSLGPRRGVARALQYLLQGFAQAPPGEPVKLFAPAPLPADVPTLDGVVHEPARSARAFRRLLPRLLAREKADVLYSPWSAFARVDIPVVAVVHELPFVRLGPIEGRWRTWNHKRWLARNVAECAAIVVPSFATRDDLLNLSACSGGKVHVIPWGFDPAPWEVAAQQPSQAKGAYAVVVGTGDRAAGRHKKGVVAACAAVRLANLAIRFVGRGRYDEEPVLRRVVAEARVLLYPSLSEGFGYPPLEAMAAGVPVVASRAGAIPEVVGDAALLVEPGDADALAQGLRRVLTEPAVARDLVRAGHERARQFPLARCAKQVAEVLRRARGIS